MAGRPKIIQDNKDVKKYLEGWVVLSYAPIWVDDILTGCSRLNLDGSTRVLSKKTLFQILMVVEEISVASLEEYGYSKKYAEKLCLILRIASKMLLNGLKKELDKKEIVYGS